MTQAEKIKEYMKTNGYITQREAIQHLHCYRLGARIWDLEHKYQVPIIHEMQRVQNSDGTWTRIARYSLAEVE